MIEPFPGAECIGPEVADHTPVRTGHGSVAPRRHTVQTQTMREKSLTGSRMDFDALAAGKHFFARGVINHGNVLFTPLLDWNACETGREGFTHDFMRTFPDHEWRGVGIEFNHWYAENKTVMLAQMSSALGTFG